MKLIIAALAVLILAGCESNMNIEQTKKELMTVDRAFCQYAIENGRRAAFEKFMADSAVIYRPGQEPFAGHDAIMTLYPPDAPGKLTWDPYFAEASGSGDLGYTLGKYEFSYIGEDDKKQVATGHYVTIWKRQPDGSWKYVFDTGT